MLVSYCYRFIFLKTKKTAGTSVELYFKPFCKAPGPAPNGDASPPNVSEFGIVGSRGNMQKFDQWWVHMPARKIRAQLGEAIWSGYFRFETIRNPYEKAVSAYFSRKKDGASQLAIRQRNVCNFRSGTRRAVHLSTAISS